MDAREKMKELEQIVSILREKGIEVQEKSAPELLLTLKVGGYLEVPVVRVPGGSLLAKLAEDHNIVFVLMDEPYILMDTAFFKLLVERLGL